MTGSEKEQEITSIEGLACPMPLSRYDKVQLAHGGGGKLMSELIEELLRPVLAVETEDLGLSNTHDGAVLTQQALELTEGKRLAFSTDSYVIQPLFFPGGSIGDLAVNGTVNDLAMCGARPLYLSLALILEEGLPMEDLHRVITDIAKAANQAGVMIVTGDTKVVDKGKGDGVFINTAGVGVIDDAQTIHPTSVRPGDKIIVSGDIGAHGVAIISVREGLEFETTIESDTAPLNRMVESIMATGARVHCLRDLTRGGLASGLNEIVTTAEVGAVIDEALVPVEPQVKAACELLGFDPLYVANEGRCMAIVAQEDANAVLKAMQEHPAGKKAAIIGEVSDQHLGTVVQRSLIGGSRIVDMLSGEQLPRIC